MSHEQFRDKCTEEVKQFATGQVDADLWHWFVRRLYYVSRDFAYPVAYHTLKTVLAEADREHGTRGNFFYYLATAPGFLSTCVHQADSAGLMDESNGQWRPRHSGEAVRAGF
jgi:glucose-6-phosphate 1-dehydrogenase